MNHAAQSSGAGMPDRRHATISRRRLLAAGAAGLAMGATALPTLSTAAHAVTPAVTRWLNRVSRPLLGTSPDLPLRDLRPLEGLVHNTAIIGLGESAHGTHEQFRLKHRLIRYLVRHHGVRTVAWEDAWGAGVPVDRYVTTGVGDPGSIVRQAGFNVRNAAMIELMEWLREFNAGRPAADQVRFLGADVVQLREVQFTELKSYVAQVAPHESDTLDRHLAMLRIHDLGPGYHIQWYLDQSPEAQQSLIDHARAVKNLIDRLPDRASEIARLDVDLHALSLLGFYESYTDQGFVDDTRTAYIVRIINRWRQRQPYRMVYSAANAHTVAVDRQVISFPPAPPMPHSLAGGRLRALLGSRYVNIGLTFDHGQITAGWDTGSPGTFTVPAPDASFIDHDLGQCRLADYLLDLHNPAPAEVRRWLTGSGTLRVIGGASYDPSNDPAHYMTAPRWGTGFDALLHLGSVTASRLP